MAGISQSVVSRTLKGTGLTHDGLASVAAGLVGIRESGGHDSYEAKEVLRKIEESRALDSAPPEYDDLDERFRANREGFGQPFDDSTLGLMVARLDEFKDRSKFVLHASILLPSLKTSASGYWRYRKIAHDTRDAIRALGPKEKGQYVLRVAKNLGWEEYMQAGGGNLDPTSKLVPGGQDWVDFEERRARSIMSARTRLAGLRWGTPYREEWLTFTSREFYELFCPNMVNQKNIPAVEPILSARYRDSGTEDTDSRKREKLFTADREEDISDPGIPEHGCFGDHYFIIDRRRDALERLHMQVYRAEGGRRKLTHRILYVVPRFLCRLIDAKALAYDGDVVVSDFAPTALQSVLTLSPMSYFASLVGTYGVGADCYGPDGRREYDGLNLVAEDGRWLLFRSNHAAKALFVSVVLISSDDEWVFALGGTNSLETRLCWTPTAMGFAIPGDFEGFDELEREAPHTTEDADLAETDQEPGGGSGGHAQREPTRLVKGIEEAAKRIILQRLPFLAESREGLDAKPPLDEAKKALQATVVGYAQDAALGMQPCFFCVVRTKRFTAAKIHERAGKIGDPLRSHRLISNDPQVSLAEMFGQQRFRNSELLRLHVFFAWKFFAELIGPAGDKIEPEQNTSYTVEGKEIPDAIEEAAGPLDWIGFNGDDLIKGLRKANQRDKEKGQWTSARKPRKARGSTTDS